MGELWLTEQGAHLSLDHGRLIVAKEGKLLAECPLSQVDQVTLLGNIEVTTPTLKRLLSHGVPFTLLGVDGRFYGRLVGQATPHVVLRRQQYAEQGRPSFVLAMAQALVKAKLANLRILLQRQRRHGRQGLDDAITALAAYGERANRTRTLNALRGVEGSGTARYFAAYRELLQGPWQMERRVRRPPTDPINVMLSLGYTLLARQAESAVEAVGLDPYAGFLHSDEYHRPSLALDLCEEFRPVIDGLVLHVCHHKIIAPEEFRAGSKGERPVVMEREALKRYITAYQERFARPILHPRTRERMPLWRFIHLQAQEVARCVRQNQTNYRGCVFR